MESWANPEMVVHDRRDTRVKGRVMGFSRLPRVGIHGQKSLRPDLDPVDIELLALVFQTVNLMETVEGTEPSAPKGKQTRE
jgi:hypothetical protein